MFVVDTNVLVHAVDRRSAFHAPAREAVERWRRGTGAWYTTWSILYELVRVVTHRSVLRPPLAVGEAWAIVESLLASPGLSVLAATSRHAAVAAEVFREVPDVSGNLVHDAHVAILMREHGIRRIYTRDTDFHRFPFLEPVDPVRAGPPGVGEPVGRYRRRRGRSTARTSR
ncbi:MAG TPA: TA system VapC family ribonuclease toxin [Anaeromyxobacteraceae bacterium]|nr:TA system VapC family ribonuclease toxin [Anaeromyxobacteraceae bacterium]